MSQTGFQGAKTEVVRASQRRLCRCSVALTALVSLSMVPASGFAQTGQEDTYAQTEPLSRFEVRISDYASMSTIASRFSIEGGHDDVVNVYVPWSQHHDLWALAPGAQLVEEDVDAWMRNLSEADKAGYRSYAEYEALFKELEAKYPNLARVENLDFMKTKQGKHIHVLKITKNVQKDHEKRPNVVITGSTHGDEWSSTAIPMNIMETMLERYGSDERVTRIFDRINTYWVPAMSPDSYHRSRNVHGVDPNRVYPYPKRQSPPRIESARNFVKWYDTLKPKGVIDFHAVHGSIIWPWGCSRKPIPKDDFKVYNDLANKMIAKTGYRQGQITKVLYDAPGVSVDAWYERYGAIAYTIEVGGSGKKPAESSLPKLIEDNREHVYTFFEHFIVGEPEEDEDEDDEDKDKDDEDKDKDDEDKDKDDEDEDEDDGDDGDDGGDEDDEDGDKDKDDDEGDNDEGDEGSEDNKSEDNKSDDEGSPDKSSTNGSGSEEESDAKQEPPGRKKGCAISAAQAAPTWILTGLVLPLLRRRRRK